jgi:GNAT superfamily N-acetyltransferase
MTVRQPRWSVRSVFERAREILREEDFPSLVFRTLGELGYRRVVLFELDLDTVPEAQPPPPGLQFEQLGPENLEDFLAISQLSDEREARRRLALGQICILGYLEQKPAYCSWLALAGQPVRIDFLRTEAEPAPRYAYSYELYVDPAARRSGIARAGFDFRVGLLRDLGVDRMVAVVVPENRGGMGHTLAAGLRPIGRVHAIRLLGFRRCWVRPALEPPPLRILS